MAGSAHVPRLGLLLDFAAPATERPWLETTGVIDKRWEPALASHAPIGRTTSYSYCCLIDPAQCSLEPVRAEPVFPIVLSLSKEALRRLAQPFDKLRANGENFIVPHQLIVRVRLADAGTAGADAAPGTGAGIAGSGSAPGRAVGGALASLIWPAHHKAGTITSSGASRHSQRHHLRGSRGGFTRRLRAPRPLSPPPPAAATPAAIRRWAPHARPSLLRRRRCCRVAVHARRGWPPARCGGCG
jgi:hypothetical protein